MKMIQKKNMPPKMKMIYKIKNNLKIEDYFKNGDNLI